MCDDSNELRIDTILKVGRQRQSIGCSRHTCYKNATKNILFIPPAPSTPALPLAFAFPALSPCSVNRHKLQNHDLKTPVCSCADPSRDTDCEGVTASTDHTDGEHTVPPTPAPATPEPETPAPTTRSTIAPVTPAPAPAPVREVSVILQ